MSFESQMDQLEELAAKGLHVHAPVTVGGEPWVIVGLSNVDSEPKVFLRKQKDLCDASAPFVEKSASELLAEGLTCEDCKTHGPASYSRGASP